jgi:hypothetical protein
MKWWNSWKKYFSDEHLFAIVPRSAYMAEFAKAWAEENKINKLGVLVGDRHLTEVDFFLKNQIEDNWIRTKAEKHAKAMSKNKFYYNLLFAVYFCKLLLGAACGSVVWLAIAFFIMIL